MFRHVTESNLHLKPVIKPFSFGIDTGFEKYRHPEVRSVVPEVVPRPRRVVKVVVAVRRRTVATVRMLKSVGVGTILAASLREHRTGPGVHLTRRP